MACAFEANQRLRAMEIITTHLYGSLHAMKSRLILARSVAAIALTVGGVSVASATDSGWYYSLNYGVFTFSSDLTKAVDEADEDTTGTGSVEDTGATWSFAMGYRINKYFGLELAYVDLGKQSFSSIGDVADLPWELLDPTVDPDDLVGLDITAKLDGDIHSTGALVNAFGTLPLGDFELTVRAGAFFAKTKFSNDILFIDNLNPAVTDQLSFKDTASTVEIMGGAGVGYTFFKHLQIRADFSYYRQVGQEDKTLTTDIATATAGVQYRF
jgi:hypothetical protein